MEITRFSVLKAFLKFTVREEQSFVAHSLVYRIRREFNQRDINAQFETAIRNIAIVYFIGAIFHGAI